MVSEMSQLMPGKSVNSVVGFKCQPFHTTLPTTTFNDTYFNSRSPPRAKPRWPNPSLPPTKAARNPARPPLQPQLPTPKPTALGAVPPPPLLPPQPPPPPPLQNGAPRGTSRHPHPLPQNRFQPEPRRRRSGRPSATIRSRLRRMPPARSRRRCPCR